MWALVCKAIRQGLRGKLKIIAGIGPAHAVYFATYESVKQAMGGNKGTEHHPIAAGKFRVRGSSFVHGGLLLTYVYLATSGACATIASDALMNPFDGEMAFPT